MTLILASTVALILLFWFKTEAIVEYFDLLSLGFLIKTKEFKEKKLKEEYLLTYPTFLRITYDTFFVRLITCPICLSVWLSILILGILILITQIYSIIILLPIICIISLILYGIVTRLLKI